MALPAIACAIGKGISSIVGGMGKKPAKNKGADVASKMFDKKEEREDSSSKVDGGKLTVIRRPKVNIEKVINKEKIEEVQVDVKDPEVDPLKNAMDGLTAMAYSMKDTVNKKVELEKKKQGYEKRRLTIFQRAGKLGLGIMSGIANAASKLAKQFDFFDTIKNFLLNVLIGGIVAGIVKNWNFLMQKWEEWKETFMEWKERFDQFLDIFNTFFWQPLKRIFAFLFGPIIKQLAKFMGVPDNEAEANTIDKNLKEILKDIPLIGDAVKLLGKDIDDELKELDVEGSVSGGSSGSNGGGPRSNMEGGGAATFGTIVSGEGGVNSVNRGVAGDTSGGAKSIFGKDLTEMTVGEIMDAQARDEVFAVGKYQIIPNTMKEFVAGSDVSRSDKFTEATQDKFRDYVINVKRPEVGRYLRGETDDPTEAGQALAREFASVGLQYGEAGRSRGQSRYAGDSAGNAASISPEEVMEALRRDRAAGSVPKPRASTPPAERQSGSTDKPTPAVADVKPPAERSSGGGSIVEYLTGDRSSSGYRADHGGGNYHEHLAFSSTAERDRAMAFLRGKGVHIGSINTGRHAPGSYHYVNQAFDVPLGRNLAIFGLPDNREGEEKFSAMIRNMLSEAGFSGAGIGSGSSSSSSSSAKVTPPAQTQTAAQAQAVSDKAFYEQLDQFIVKARIPVPSGGGGGGRDNSAIISSGSKRESLNRKQQYDYKKFLYKG